MLGDWISLAFLLQVVSGYAELKKGRPQVVTR